MSDRETTRDLMSRLERHYIKPGQPFPGGVFVPECGRNGGGSGQRCDALYVGFTSTSGRLLIGHEVKASRADWRKELDTNGKADQWADDCHAWYVVAPSTEIVRPDELPAGWGLMVPSTRTRTRMEIKVKALEHFDRQPSWDTVRSILARQDTLRAQAIADIRTKARDDAHEELEQARAAIGESALSPEQRSRLMLLDRLENELGMDLDAWFNRDDRPSPKDVAAGVRIAMNAPELARHARSRYAINDLRDMASALTKQLNAWGELLDGLQAIADGRTP